jgi:hypothetical protein
MGALTPPYYGDITPATTPDVTALADRINSDGRYQALVQEAFGTPQATHVHLIDAVNAYIATLKTTTNKYDRYLAGEEGALTASARRGLHLFEGKAKCANCHTTGVGVDGARLTDGAHHNTGVAFKDVALRHLGRKPDAGIGAVTFVQRDQGSFKTPSLRDVALRPPYMHDGSLATLADVVDYYDRGGTSNGGLDGHIHDLALNAQEKADLVSFLESLTGEERAGLAAPPKDLGHEVKVRLLDVNLNPMQNFAFEVRPFGDRFKGVLPAKESLTVRTDAKGYAVFPFPAMTHAMLTSANHEIGLSRAIPDCVREMDLIVTPRSQVSLRILSDKPLPKSIEVKAADLPRAELPGVNVLATFKWVRDLSTTDGAIEAIYVAANPKPDAPKLVKLWMDNQPSPLVEVDLSGGASETLDLRAVQTPRRVPPRRAPPPNPPTSGNPGDGRTPNGGTGAGNGGGVKTPPGK